MRQRGLTPLLIIVVVALLFGLGYWGYKSGTIKINLPQDVTITTSPSPTADPTANWKTYTNTRYGYAIKYPQNWMPNRGPGGLTDQQLSTQKEVDFYDPSLPGGDPGTGLNIQTNSRGSSGESINCTDIDDCFAKTFGELTQSANITKQTTTFLGQPAIKFNYQRKTDLHTQSWQYLYFIYKGDAYSIYVSTDTSREKEIFSTFDQIVSTFKFIK